MLWREYKWTLIEAGGHCGRGFGEIALEKKLNQDMLVQFGSVWTVLSTQKYFMNQWQSSPLIHDACTAES